MNISALQRESPGAASQSKLSVSPAANDPKLKGFQEKLNQLQSDLNSIVSDRMISSEEKQEKRRQIRQQMAEINRKIQAAKREEQQKKAAESMKPQLESGTPTENPPINETQSSGETENTAQQDKAENDVTQPEDKKEQETEKSTDQELEDISLPPRKINKLIAASDAVNTADNLKGTAQSISNKVDVISGEMHTDSIRNRDTSAKAQEREDLSSRQDKVQQASSAYLHKAQEKTRELINDDKDQKHQNIAKAHFQQSQQAQKNAAGITSATFHVSM